MYNAVNTIYCMFEMYLKTILIVLIIAGCKIYYNFKQLYKRFIVFFLFCTHTRTYILNNNIYIIHIVNSDD